MPYNGKMRDIAALEKACRLWLRLTQTNADYAICDRCIVDWAAWQYVMHGINCIDVCKLMFSIKRPHLAVVFSVPITSADDDSDRRIGLQHAKALFEKTLDIYDTLMIQYVCHENAKQIDATKLMRVITA